MGPWDGLTGDAPIVDWQAALSTMTEYEKYLFDLNGYLVVEDALSAEQVASLNAALNSNRDRISKRDCSLDGRSDDDGGSPSIGLQGDQGRGEFSDVFFWPEPWCRPFRGLLALPAAMKWMIATIGDEFCFNSFQGITQVAGSEGQILHGGRGCLVHRLSGVGQSFRSKTREILVFQNQRYPRLKSLRRNK